MLPSAMLHIFLGMAGVRVGRLDGDVMGRWTEEERIEMILRHWPIVDDGRDGHIVYCPMCRFLPCLCAEMDRLKQEKEAAAKGCVVDGGIAMRRIQKAGRRPWVRS